MCSLKAKWYQIITPAALIKATGSTKTMLRRALRRRQVVEATIGRLKFLHRLGRNFLAGLIGDKMNVILAAAGHNFRAWLRLFLALHTFCHWQGIFANWSWPPLRLRPANPDQAMGYAA